MAKIFHLPKKDKDFANIREFLEDAITRLEEEGIESVIIAGKARFGQVVTGYYKCDQGTKQELNGHIQCDIIDCMIRANPERYGIG